jgi:hypothetical protein
MSASLLLASRNCQAKGISNKTSFDQMKIWPIYARQLQSLRDCKATLLPDRQSINIAHYKTICEFLKQAAITTKLNTTMIKASSISKL